MALSGHQASPRSQRCSSSISWFSGINMVGSMLKAVTLCALLFFTSPTQGNDELKRITSGSHTFGKALFAQFANQGNVVVSPMSAYLALAMARLGAKGQTKQEISDSLGFAFNEDFAQGFSDLIGGFSSSKDARVVVANRIFVQDKLTLDPKFNEKSQKILKASAENVNFGGATAAETINHWVRNATRNRILDIVGSVNGDTKVMLVNVLYFRGPWEYRFYTPSEPRPFYLDESKTVDAQFMSNEDYYGISESSDLDAQIIEVPYKDKDYSFVIILPKTRNGLVKLEPKVATLSFEDLFANMKREEITLHVPTFQIETSAILNAPLQRMGLNTMFSDNADFSGLAGGKLKVSEVLQKTYFEINENGTEAAASTAIRIVPVSLKLQELIVTCDRPFLFYLMHKRSTVLFQGKFVDPRVEKVTL